MKRVSVGRRERWEDSISSKDFVLDVGCWGGEKVEVLMKKTNGVFGMDIDKPKINSAKKKVKRRLKFGDITKNIPFGRKFNWIIFGEVLEHIEGDNAALMNINNALKDRGKLILTTPRHVPFFQIWDPAWVRWKFLGGQRHHHYTQEELFSKLQKNGFIIKEYYIIGNLSWVIYRWINVIMKYVFRVKKGFMGSKVLQSGFCDWVILAQKSK